MADRLAEIAARAEAASTGPWMSDGAEIYSAPNGYIDTEQWVAETLNLDNEKASKANAAFIAHARADVPWLLAEIRRLQNEVAELAAENAILERALGLNEGAAA
ncbi:hypothetical protein [Streptomyces sp. NPDC059015]|uniref:hypothetical protein n=1 Tax=unclassified Streptomyces TaxID=2593676 RepID=UPI0036B2F676